MPGKITPELLALARTEIAAGASIRGTAKRIGVATTSLTYALRGRQPIKAKPQPPLPCISCRHGEPSRYAELGWECRSHLAAKCQPLGQARRYEPSEGQTVAY